MLLSLCFVTPRRNALKQQLESLPAAPAAARPGWCQQGSGTDRRGAGGQGSCAVSLMPPQPGDPTPGAQDPQGSSLRQPQGSSRRNGCTEGTGLLCELCKHQTAERFSQHIQPLLLAHSIMLKRPFFICKEFKKSNFSLYKRRFQVYRHSPSSFSLFCHYCF